MAELCDLTAHELAGRLRSGEATTADVVALMVEGRARVRERFGVELEPEVQVLGDVDTAGLHA